MDAAIEVAFKKVVVIIQPSANPPSQPGSTCTLGGVAEVIKSPVPN
jgi:hypothetical protein